MKKIALIVLAFLFFLILLSLVLFKLLHTSTGTLSGSNGQAENPFSSLKSSDVSIQTNNPNSAVISCYQWYIPEFITGKSLSSVAKEAQAALCFTPRFISTWFALNEETDPNPLFTTADFGPSWTSRVTAKAAGYSSKASTQEVILGSGDDELHVFVHLLLQDDYTWKIDSVTKTP